MRGVWVPSLCPTVETEERIFRWMVVATVAFFLLAATSITPSNRPSHHVEPVHKPRPPPSNTTQAWKQYEMVKEQVVRQVFLKLKDEHVQFWTEREAKSFLSPRTDNRRKAFCGGWASDVPRLVLHNMGRRCPPLELS